MESNYDELSRRLRAIPNRLVVTGVTDASISSSSLDAVDNSLSVAPIAAATSALTASSDILTTAAADQNNLLIVLDSRSSSEFPSCTASLENTKSDSSASGIRQNSVMNTKQPSRPRPVPVPPPRRPKPVTGSNSSNLSQLSASVTSNQKPAMDVVQQTSSYVMSSAPMQSVQEARSLFIQSTTPPLVKVNPRQSSLDQFDPLASGQLVVDGPTSRVSSVAESTEEDLLKEWDLDFSQSKAEPRFVCPDVSLQPRVMMPPSAVYASMPNLGPGSMRMRYPAYRVGFPPQPVRQPWMLNTGVGHHSPGPAAAVLTANGTLDRINRCATLPTGLASVPLQTQPLSEVSGSTVDVTRSTATSDWSANIDVLMRPHSMDLNSLTSTLPNSQQPPASQVWEKFD